MKMVLAVVFGIIYLASLALTQGELRSLTLFNLLRRPKP